MDEERRKTLHRIRREWIHAQRSPIPGITTQPIGESDDDMFHWTGSMIGPEGSPYQGGIFNVDIVLPHNYGLKPPLCRFTTKLFHPNISPEAYHPIDCPGGGEIEVNILIDGPGDGLWNPALSIPTVLLSIQSLLTDPNPIQAVNGDAGRMLRDNSDLYNRTVQEWVRDYATPP